MLRAASASKAAISSRPASALGKRESALEKSRDKSDPEKLAKFDDLQQRLEQLEKVHVDGKKKHHAEMHGVKHELDRTRKVNHDTDERASKLRSHNEALDAQLRELRKAALAHQAEMKALQIKLRAAEHERDQRAHKQSEVIELKKALSESESKRKQEVQEKQKAVAEAEKVLTAEKKRGAATLAQLEEYKMKSETGKRQMEKKLEEARSRAEKAERMFEEQQEELGRNGTSQTERIEQLEDLLQLVTQEYSRLASSTVASLSYDALKLEGIRLKLINTRLERKLKNTEDQVQELVHLIRQTKEQNYSLAVRLQETEVDMQRLLDMFLQADDGSTQRGDTDILRADVQGTISQNLAQENEVARALQDVGSSLCSWAGETNHVVVGTYTDAVEQLELETFAKQDVEARLQTADAIQTTLLAEKEAATSELQTAQAQVLSAQEEVTKNANALKDLERKLGDQQDRSSRQERSLRNELARRDELIKMEREISQKLESHLQQAQNAEEALQDEVAQLSLELEEAEPYRTAYENIVQHVDALVDRHALAEEEAEKLSRLNAEILGHHNPVQRIYYVDKIRRELAETKQKLLSSVRDCQSAREENVNLRHELGMYKSVAAPITGKPRTNITRVTRIPLGPRGLNEETPEESTSWNALAAHVPQITADDLTLEDLM